MKKLWQKENTRLNKFIEAFEIKDDLLQDQKLVKHDIQGSLAHAKMLLKIGILNTGELEKLGIGFEEILELNKKGRFKLKLGDEDIHTKIENYLTEKYGEVGKKIHTGRSRNDQVLTAIRLLSKEKLSEIQQQILGLIQGFQLFSKQYGGISVPGYTHMQKAMPSTLKLWSESFKDSLLDDLVLIKAVYKLNNQSPLGSAAGYGVPLNLDKEYSAKLMNFSKVQNNFLYCQNSRGKIEASILAGLISVLQTLNKFASDILLFTTSEFNFFKVAKNLTTGSSIMPQKKNVDLAELLRSKLHIVLGNYVSIISLSSNLISGYNRDLQDTKKSLFESLEITFDALKVSGILLKNLTPNEEVLKAAMTPELYAAGRVYQLVKEGMTFREAYSQVKESEEK